MERGEIDLDTRAYWLPLLPSSLFFALRHGFRAYPLARRWRVDDGDLVNAGSPLLTYERGDRALVSIVAPFSGKVVARSLADHCEPGVEWPDHTDFPGRSTRHGSVGALQPVSGYAMDPQRAVELAYAEIVAWLKQELQPQRSFFKRVLDPSPTSFLERVLGPRTTPEINLHRDVISADLAKLLRARARVVPLDADPDESAAEIAS